MATSDAIEALPILLKLLILIGTIVYQLYSLSKRR